jgi:hypothetical protein
MSWFPLMATHLQQTLCISFFIASNLKILTYKKKSCIVIKVKIKSYKVEIYINLFNIKWEKGKIINQRESDINNKGIFESSSIQEIRSSHFVHLLKIKFVGQIITIKRTYMWYSQQRKITCIINLKCYVLIYQAS